MTRLARAKLFNRSLLYGQRDYFVLTFRKLLYSSNWLLFLHYPGDSSSKLNELRYLAAYDGVQVKLLLRRWLPSIFLNNNRYWIPFNAPLLVLYSAAPEGILNFLQRAQLPEFLEWFTFCGLSCQGFISQDCNFSSLLEHPAKLLLQLLGFLQLQLLPLWYSALDPYLFLLDIFGSFLLITAPPIT